MRQTTVFQQSLKRMAGFYAVLAVAITLFFTIVPLVAQQQARSRLDDLPLRDQNPPSEVLVFPFGDDPAAQGQVQQFVAQRDNIFGRHFTTTFLELNGVLLLICVAASYYLARRSLEPLSEVLESQETFAAELAHELKTPLATVMLELESFKRAGKNLTKEQQASIGEITQSVKGVGTLVEQTLSLIAVDYVDHSAYEMVAIADIVKNAAAPVRKIAQEKGVQFKVRQRSAAAVKGNNLQLQQLFTVLLENAVKFTPAEGRVELIIDDSAKDKVVITVCDTGIGMTAEQQAHIFDKFYQADPTNGEGAGLGLAIAKRVVDLHNGTIVVKSEPGKGSAFVVTLPVVTRS